MARKKPKSGGGWQAIRYTMGKAGEIGPLNLWRAMTAKNACKTCALGMGGQRGGMRNEAGHFPEVCKKSLQAMVADMRGKIEPRFFETYSIDQLRTFSPRELELAGRLTEPVMAGPGDTHYRVVAWEEALDAVAEGLRGVPPDRAIFYSSGRSSNEAGFLLQLFARAFGTNHVFNCSYYCHQASGVGLADALGTGTSTVTLEDLAQCDLVFLIGGNPASNHPRLVSELERLRRRGGQVVVVNPLREVGLVNFRVPSNVRSLLFGSPIASIYVQPTIGGDIAFLLGVAKCLLDSPKAIDRAFVDDCTEGYQELEAAVRNVEWAEIEAASGVTQKEIEDVAKLYAASKRTIFAWTMGITHHEHGVQNVQWIVNLALLRGMIGMPGAGVMPIRGHSNVQGLGSVGVTPRISQKAIEGLSNLGIPFPTFPGYDTMSATEAAARGEVDFALCLGGNFFGASPDAGFTEGAMGNVGTVAYMSTTLNTGHAWGLGRTTVILPVLARDEEPEPTTQESMFNYVRLSDGGAVRWQGPRAEAEILADLAGRVIGNTGPLNWAKLANHDEIRALIAQLIPGYDPIANISKTKEEFHIGGRILHEQKFNRANGRAAFRTHSIPRFDRLSDSQLQLMTIRSEGQFNTVVYEEEDLYRGQDRRDVILMHAEDISQMGFAIDMPIDVEGPSGIMRGILVREAAIARGCAAMYYPEANVLLPRTIDPRSKTPAFKSCVVTVSQSSSSARDPESVSNAEHARDSRGKMRAC